jgi:hypothetical protein
MALLLDPARALKVVPIGKLDHGRGRRGLVDGRSLSGGDGCRRIGGSRCGRFRFSGWGRTVRRYDVGLPRHGQGIPRIDPVAVEDIAVLIPDLGPKVRITEPFARQIPQRVAALNDVRLRRRRRCFPRGPVVPDLLQVPGGMGRPGPLRGLSQPHSGKSDQRQRRNLQAHSHRRILRHPGQPGPNISFAPSNSMP